MRNDTARKNSVMTAAIYIILFLVYNLLVFVIFKEKNGVFWMSYAFGVIAFIVQFVSMAAALGRQETESVFWGIPLASLSFYYFFAALFVAVVFMAFHNAPFTLALVLQILIVAAYAVVALLALMARNTTQDISDNIRNKAEALHVLNVDVDVLLPQVSDPAVRKAIQRVSDTIKYSDPMSNEHVMDIENQIMNAVNVLRAQVGHGANAEAIQTCRDIEALFLRRNNMLKATK